MVYTQLSSIKLNYIYNYSMSFQRMSCYDNLYCDKWHNGM